MYKFVLLALPLAAGLTFPVQSQTATGLPGEGKVLKTTATGSISPEWVKWNKSSCAYEAVNEHPSTWSAELRAMSQPLKLGFAEQGENTGQLADVNNSVKATAKEAGIDLVVGNYNYPSTTDPISQSAAMALQKPAAVISYHVIANLLEPANSNFEKLCIPIVQVTVGYKNVPRFGLSNQDAGNLMGQFLSDWAAREKWAPAETSIVASRNPVFGADVTDRMTKCADAAVARLPGVKVDYLDVGSDAQSAQVAMTNWLTAHPNNHKILACGFADNFATGFANAFESARRVSDGVVVGTGGSEQARQMIKAGSAFRGTVNQRYNTYGQYLVPLVQDVLAGKPVPAVVHQKLEMMHTGNL